MSGGTLDSATTACYDGRPGRFPYRPKPMNKIGNLSIPATTGNLRPIRSINALLSGQF